jgi:hypothetical protein
LSKATRLAVLWAVLLLIVLALIGFVAYSFFTYLTSTSGGGSTGGSSAGGSQSNGGTTQSQGSNVKSNGGAGLGVIITYADGRTQAILPEQIRYSLFPLTVYCEGEPISKITWVTYVYLDWTGELTCIELKGPMTVASNTGVTLRKENMWRKTGVNWNMPSKGSWVEIWRFTLEAGDIEYSLGGGDYTLTCTSSVSATATFSNGASNSLSAEAKANLQIHIEAPRLTVLKVDIQSQAWRQK